MSETIDFEALSPEPFKIKAMDGSVWLATPDLMGDEAMYFIRNRSNLEGLDAAERCVKVFLRCLRVHRPKLTEAEMLAAFTLPQIIGSVMRFLSRAGLGAFSPPRATSPTTPKKSKVKSQRRRA